MEKILDCIYGSGCLLKIVDPTHNIKYYHHKNTLLEPCTKERCASYIMVASYVRDRIVSCSNDEWRQHIKHVALFYHAPIVLAKSSATLKPRQRSVDLSQIVSHTVSEPRGSPLAEVPALNLTKSQFLTRQHSLDSVKVSPHSGSSSSSGSPNKRSPKDKSSPREDLLHKVLSMHKEKRSTDDSPK
jgi:hypothetical protein